MPGHELILGQVKRHTRDASKRVRSIQHLPMEARLEELREARLSMLAAVDAIETALSLAAVISQITGTPL